MAGGTGPESTVSLPHAVPQHQGCRRPRQLQLVQASVFGVGAPEAILVGVVALLVFGPKGLAQVGQLQVSLCHGEGFVVANKTFHPQGDVILLR